MPFDGSGNYSRVHDWTTDRDNGIKIQASRMDDEFDDIASSLNVVFFRNGLVPMTGDLSMGANDIKGISSGTVAAPSVQFSADPNTGLYLPAVGELGITANGVQRLRTHSTGVAITGVATVSSTLDVTGNTTLAKTAINVSSAGATTEPLDVKNNGAGANTLAALSFYAAATKYARILGGYGAAAPAMKFEVDGVTVANLASTGIDINSGTLTVGGSTVWHAGNDGAGSGLDADLLDGAQGSAYALLAGAAFTGSFTASIGANNFTVTTTGQHLRMLNGSELGIIALGATGTIDIWAHGDLATDIITLRTGSGSGTIRATISSSALATTVPITVSGSTVWHAGNDGAGSGLDADLLDGAQGSAYALLAGATFTGGVSAVNLTSTGAQEGLRIQDDSAYISWYNSANTTRRGYLQHAGVNFSLVAEVGGIALSGTTVTINGSTVWHAGNDGAGSGLDADLLDGVQGSDYKRLPRSTTAGTIVVGDIGKCVAISAGITVPNATFAAGDVVSIYNDSAGALTITQGASLTLRQAGTTNTGNRTLAARGLATVWFNGASEAIISGTGLT